MDNFTSNKKKIEEGFIGQQMLILPPNVKKTFLRNPLIKNFYLTNIGFYPKAFYHDRERKTGSSQYILLYCVEGSGTIYLQDKQFQLLPNTYFIIPKNVSHRYASSEHDPWSIYWVHFSGEYADLLYVRNLENNQTKVRAVPYDEDNIKLFEKTYSILEHSYDEREMEMMNLTLLHFLSSLVYHKDSIPTLNDFVADSISYMKTKLGESLSIKQLANQQNISISHYSNLFKNKTGVSPIYYFNQLKVHKSCQYLYFTDRSVKEISNELGFEDPYYFSRLFKKLIGVSPMKYKTSHRNSL